MRAVRVEQFGGPEALELRDVPAPRAGENEVRVRVSAMGINPMDWKLSSTPTVADMFGVVLPSGFGQDFAGTVDEVGDGVDGFVVGDRVFGAALASAAAEYLVVTPSEGTIFHTPAGMGDAVASTLFVTARTADAALNALNLSPGETVLVGGAAGGVGVVTVQLAKLRGANVIGTASPESFDFVRELGAEPVAYGPGLADRVRALAPQGVDAATSLVGAETVDVALALGVPAERVSSIDAGPNPPGGARATGGQEAAAGAVERVAAAVASGSINVHIDSIFSLEQIREAVARQSAGHAHGKVVINVSNAARGTP